jgi:hypothetical protein
LTPSYHWQPLDDQEVEVKLGCCRGSRPGTQLCDASVEGGTIFIKDGSAELQGVIYATEQAHGGCAGRCDGTQGSSISFNSDNSIATWSGGVHCGCDRVETVVAQRYQCTVVY